jgi:hypothetical protein
MAIASQTLQFPLFLSVYRKLSFFLTSFEIKDEKVSRQVLEITFFSHENGKSSSRSPESLFSLKEW